MTRAIATPAVFLVLLPAAFAHGVKTTSDAELAVEGTRVRLQILLTLHDLAGAVLADRNSSGTIDEEEGNLAREAIVSYCRKRFMVEGKEGELQESGGEVEYEGEFPVGAADLERVKVVVTLSYEAPREPEALRFRLLHSPVGHEEHECRLRVRWADREEEQVVRSGEWRDLARDAPGGRPKPGGAAESTSAWSGVDFVLCGLLLALLAPLKSGRRFAFAVGPFAAGNALGVFAPAFGPGPRIAAALAAGGIVYLAVENLLARDPRWRWAVGLVLGFVLGRASGPSDYDRMVGGIHVLIALFGGSALAAILWTLRKNFPDRMERLLAVPLSVLLALAGVVLAVDALLASPF